MVHLHCAPVTLGGRSAARDNAPGLTSSAVRRVQIGKSRVPAYMCSACGLGGKLETHTGLEGNYAVALFYW